MPYPLSICGGDFRIEHYYLYTIVPLLHYLLRALNDYQPSDLTLWFVPLPTCHAIPLNVFRFYPTTPYLCLALMPYRQEQKKRTYVFWNFFACMVLVDFTYALGPGHYILGRTSPYIPDTLHTRVDSTQLNLTPLEGRELHASQCPILIHVGWMDRTLCLLPTCLPTALHHCRWWTTYALCTRFGRQLEILTAWFWKKKNRHMQEEEG